MRAGAADRLRGQRDQRLVHRALPGFGERRAIEQVLRIHRDLGEIHAHQLLPGVIGQIDQVDPGAVGRDEQRDELPVEPGDDEQGVGTVGEGHQCLRAREHDTSVRMPRGERNALDIRRVARLLPRRHHDALAGGDRRQPPVPLGVAARQRDQARRQHAARDVRHRRQATAQFLVHDRAVDQAETHAAMRLRHQHTGHAGLAERMPHAPAVAALVTLQGT
jgi:hypothetical protein